MASADIAEDEDRGHAGEDLVTSFMFSRSATVTIDFAARTLAADVFQRRAGLLEWIAPVDHGFQLAFAHQVGEDFAGPRAFTFAMKNTSRWSMKFATISCLILS